MMNTNLEQDYKKWILFNNELSEFQSLYDLYTSVNQKSSKGIISVESDEENGTGLVIKQEGYDKRLKIKDEESRKMFLEYLVQHYLPNENIEGWYQEKIKEKDKLANHSIVSTPSNNEPLDFKVHPKETRYYQWRVFFSALFYLSIIGYSAFIFFNKNIIGGIGILVVVLVALFLGLFIKIAQGLFVGLMQGSSVRLNENQYPEIYKIVTEQASLIGLKKTPNVYILQGAFNAFVTNFARKKHLFLYSEVIETASKGDLDVLKFVVGHELGHIKRRHLSREIWLLPSSFIPLLKQAHSRACEYTCDRIGYHFSAKGAVEGILILATGKEIHSKINPAKFVEDAQANTNFWVWLSEKFLTHPFAFKRMSEIKKYADRNANFDKVV